MPAARRAAVALSVWTLLVWTTRIGTVWGDETSSLAGRTGRLALALSFTVLALTTLLMRRRPQVVIVVRVFAAWTIVVWVVRGIDIVLGDHSAAFIAVHLVIAVISVGLAVAAVRLTTASASIAPVRT
jgi:hypothetical protein